MNLQNQKIKINFGKILTIIFILFFIAVVIRLSTWENDYYKNQEGKERITPRTTGDVSTDSTDVDETVVTQEQTQQYTVAADQDF